MSSVYGRCPRCSAWYEPGSCSACRRCYRCPKCGRCPFGGPFRVERTDAQEKEEEPGGEVALRPEAPAEEGAEPPKIHPQGEAQR